MRRTRWLLLAALLSVIASVGYIYFGRLATMARERAPEVKPLPGGIEATAQGWHYVRNDGDCPALEVRAKDFKQIKEPATLELSGVDLKMFRDCGKRYDRVESAKAQFDTATGAMFSEGEVRITKNIPAGEEAPSPEDAARLLHIVSSGVLYETKSGNASTDRAATFSFNGGDGKCVGAAYDPAAGELRLNSGVELNMHAKGPDGKPAKIEAGRLIYYERESKVLMEPWSRLTRDTMVLNTASAVAMLENEKIKYVEGDRAAGVQTDPNRKIEYQAEKLRIHLNDNQQIESVGANDKAHLVSTSDAARTDVKADTIDLTFKATDKDSVLSHASARGHAIVDSNPIAKTGTLPGDTRILRSDTIELGMRGGGREIEAAETQGPGTIEFIPNRPGQPHRTLDGDKIWVTYGANNQVQRFRSVNVRTQTDNPPKQGKPVPPVITTSAEFVADFDPKTNQMSHLEQPGNFRYQEGDRKAQSDKATLEQSTGLMTLTGLARIADPTGSAAADRIVLNQKTGDFDADGHVNSTRLPDKKGASSAMLNNEEPMQAKADRMSSRESNLLIHYEGNAVAWQGANRVQGDRLDIDRDEEVMKAAGSVVSQFLDKPKKDKDGKPLANQPPPVYTIVRAPEMTYAEETRAAVYKGGVVLNRPNMTVRSRELTAFLKDKDSDSSLDKAFADGAVNIFQTSPGRTRTGTSEHAEYYAGEEKIILEKGQPKFVDSLKGTTQGQKLTYFANDDRLLVNGTEAQRATSVIRRKNGAPPK